MSKRSIILTRKFVSGRQAALVCQGRGGTRRTYRPQDHEWEAGYEAATEPLRRICVNIPIPLLTELKASEVPLSLATELGVILAALGNVRGVTVEGDRVVIVLGNGQVIEWSTNANATEQKLREGA